MILPLSEVKPGMEGYGLTVFEGTKVERFHVRVIGIVRKFLPRQDVILFRSDDPRLKHTGIIRGMSGSPVFVGGKLVGAVAYGFPYSKDPIGGITPIEAMMEVGEWPLKAGKEGGVAVREGTSGQDLLARFFGGERSRGGSETAPLGPRGATEGIQRMAIPLSMAGFHPRVVEEMRTALAPLGIEPMVGGGGGEVRSRGPATFEPGAPIGVALVRGDVSAVATGTVTHVEGNRVLAFGHPMVALGEWSAPVMTAEIHTVLPSIAASFKLSSPVAEAGALVMDRMAAIVADTSARAAMVPVETTVSVAGGVTRSARSEVVQHRILTPLFTAAVLMNAVQEASPDPWPAVVRIRSTVKIAGYDAITFDDKVFSFDGMSPRLIGFTGGFRALQELFLNPFEEVTFEKIRYDVEVTYGTNAAELLGISVDSLEVEPGQKVNLRLTLRRLHGQEFERVVDFTVPKEFAGQTMAVEVVPGNLAQRPLPLPENLRGMIENYRKPPFPSDTIVVVLRRPAEGLAYKGRLLPDLPPSAIDTFRQVTSIRRIEGFQAPIFVPHSTGGMVVVGKLGITLRVKALP